MPEMVVEGDKGKLERHHLIVNASGNGGVFVYPEIINLMKN
jgi:hypothetical protein